MKFADRVMMTDMLRGWLANAEAGVEIAKDVPPGIIALLKNNKKDPQE